jgi:hypothetical protein
MSDPSRVADFLVELQRQAGAGGKGPPPVERWNPPDCGDAGIEIRADGSWWHEGARMTREALVRLFATILRKDEDGVTYLVTPHEKVRVAVADAHFLAVHVDRTGAGEDQTIAFTTNVGDVVALGPERPLRLVHAPSGEPRPYVLVRGRLEARILRAPFFELANWAVEREGAMGVWSGGKFWELG